MIRRIFRVPWRTSRAIATDVDDELRFHLEARTDALIRAGQLPDAARLEALREFGDVDDARRYLNAVDRQIEAERRRKDFMGDIAHDLTYAVRQLRRAPAFATSAILTLAIGIGANTTVLNLVNATLLKPPPVERSDELAWISPMTRNGRYDQWSLPKFMDFRNASRSWSGVAALGNVDLALGGTEAIRLSGQAVSANYFDLLGVRPSLGRGFLAYEDSAVSGAMPIILSHALWTKRFSGDSAVIGSTVLLNQVSMSVVGVISETFNGLRVGEECDFWIPIASLPRLDRRYATVHTARDMHWLRAVGRLAPGASHERAQAEANLIRASFDADVTRAEDRRTIAVAEMRGGLDPMGRSRMGPVISLLMLVPLLVLGVACANVANLFVSRGVQRRKELGVRRALGASRGRIVRQLLTECALLGVAAGVVGVGLSYGLTAVIVGTGNVPQDVARLLVPDLSVFAMTFALAIGAGAIFGLVPALAETRYAITPALGGDGIATHTGLSRHRLRNAFVVSQVSLSLSLLITAGLFVGSLQKALHVDPGYDPHNTIAMRFDLRGLGYDSARIARFGPELIAHTRDLPGIEAVALASIIPLSGSSASMVVDREQAPSKSDGSSTLAARVSSDFFAAMRIPIVLGRAFTDRDDLGSTRSVVINEQLASVLWPGEHPIGKRVRLGGDSTLAEVVGVARNGKYRRLAETSQESYLWLPTTQRPIGAQGTLVLRAQSTTVDAVNAARRALGAIDPGLPAFGIETLDASIARTVEAQRGGAALLALFGTIALVLAAFGIFGVIAQGVAARRREIGIRMSLGAQAEEVVRSFVREGLTMTIRGAAIGIALSLAASKMLSSLLFGLEGTDALTFVGATAILLGIAALASFVPARRAARVDPLIALRSD